ncbi:MAG: barstar family protein [Deltaproteobacteria bacterium]|nr:barstar family protein [Deltaproteobacteria bacterium]
MKKLESLLSRRETSGVYGLEGDWPLDQLKAMTVRHDCSFFHLDGRNIDNKEDFLRQMAETLAFPGYFGNNWDALADCLTDMSWHETQGYVVLIESPDRLAKSVPEDFAVLLDVFQETADFWRMHDKAWYVLFGGRGVESLDLPMIEALNG